MKTNFMIRKQSLKNTEKIQFAFKSTLIAYYFYYISMFTKEHNIFKYFV